MSKNDRQQTGKLGEQLAVRYLMALPSVEAWRIEAQNWRCRRGEIDIIAYEKETLVFLEVRTRHRGGTLGEAIESVDARKQRQVRQTAQYYMANQRLYDVSARFDVIAITLDHDEQLLRLEHYRNAFS